MNNELIMQCDREDMEAVRKLLEGGAEVNCQDGSGRTPLMAAVQKNNLDLAKLLMEAGGDLNIRDNTLLTPWLCAGANGFHKILREALKYSPDIRSSNRFGGTVLLPSSEKGYLKTVEVAIAAGVPVNHVNDLGWSALQEAVILGNGGYLYSDIIRMLMDAGANPDLRDNEGKTALDWAGERNQERVTAILEGREVLNMESVPSRVRALIKGEEYDKALAILEEALDSQPKDLELYYLTGYVLVLLERHGEAVEVYRKALERGGAPEFYFHTANTLRTMKRVEEALAEYDLAIAMDQADFFYRYHKSNYLRELGRHEDALKEMAVLIGQNPSRYDYYFHQANSLRSLGRHKEAAESMDHAMAADPGNPLYVLHKGKSMALLGEYDEALALFSRAIEMKETANPLFERGTVLRALEREEEAKRDFQRTLEIAPTHKEARQALLG